MVGHRSWNTILWSLTVTAAVALSVGAAPSPAPATDITGATYAELDDATGIWTLRGTPVSVRRGATTVRAASIIYETRAQVLRAEGGVRYDDGALSVAAASVTAWLGEQRLLATGSPVATTADGTLTSDRIEAFGDREEVLAEGNARLVYEDIEGRAPRLLLQRRVAVATFSGGAVIRQGPHAVRAETVVVDLRRRRVTARGGASITVQTDR